jgi:CheY-like chemotaxis protein
MFFLQNQNGYKNSDTAGKIWLARIVNEYNDKFVVGKVSFILEPILTGTISSKPLKLWERGPRGNIMDETNPLVRLMRSKQPHLDEAILGIAQAYGPYDFWLDNINPMANPDTTWRALMVVSALRNVAFVEKAMFLLNSPNSRVRAWSCYYLSTAMHIQASDKMLALANDPSPRVRYHALKAFITMRPGSENVFAGNRRLVQSEFSILISEDHPKGRENLAKMLRNDGFITYTAATEKETMELALKTKPQVIVTDNQKISLTDNQKYVDNISGLNMTWDICRLPELGETILIMLTADKLEPIFLWQGGDIYLSKELMEGAMLGIICQEFMQ